MADHRFLSFVVGVVAASTAAAQPPLIGKEFQVNVQTLGQQRDPAVAVEDDGGFAVTWSSLPQPGSSQNVFAQRFRANGSRRGSVFQLSQPDGDGSAIAVDANDDFIVVWRTYDFVAHKSQVLGRRVLSNGAIQSLFTVSTPESLGRLSIDAAADGDFAIAWERNFGLAYARAFDAPNAAKGPEFQVNTSGGSAIYPSTGADEDGNFVVAWWDSTGRDGDQSGIFARRFDTEGLPQSAEFQVNTYTPSAQMSPGAAMAPDGSFVIVWIGFQDYAIHIFGQRFDSNGAPLATEFQVDTATGYPPAQPVVATDARGDFVVAWVSTRYNVNMPRGVFARRFDRDGAVQGDEFQLDAYDNGQPAFPAIAMDASGNAVVVWQAEHDGAGAGIFGRRVGDLIRFDVDGDGMFGALTDAQVLLRYDLGFRGDSLIAGAISEESCTRCDVAAVQTFIEGLGMATDIDGNGQVGPLTDGLLRLRWAFGLEGAGLATGATGIGCTRCAPQAIADYLTIWAD